MPKLSSLQLLERIEKRLRDLESGIDIKAREINALLSPTQRTQLKADWRAQLKLRKLKRPSAFTAYETKHKTVVAWLGKCHKMLKKTRTERDKLLTAQHKCAQAIDTAHNTAIKLITANPINGKWFDRDCDISLYTDSLSPTDLDTNTWLLLLLYVQLPIIVTSRNADKQLTVEQRFGWKSIREVRIDCYKQALKSASGSLLEDLENELYRLDVKRADTYLKNFFAAKDEHKNADVVANNALTRAGLRRYDGREAFMNTRDKEIWAMDAAIQAKAESEMTEDEREQLEILREHEAAVAKRKNMWNK